VLKLGHDGPTRCKTRVRSAGQSLLRIDDGGPGCPTTVDLEQVRCILQSAEAVLVSDYGAGLTRDSRIREVLTEAAGRTRLVWDPHPKGGSPVGGAAVVTPNLAEAALTTERPGIDRPDLLARRLRGVWAAESVCITAGAVGAFLAGADGQSHFLPAPAVHGGDPCGAGDRFAATVTVALARGALTIEAVTAGVGEASNWVAAGGAASFQPASAPDLVAIEGVSSHTEPVTGPESLPGLAARLRTGIGDHGTLVATGGCFDIVHAGHVGTLQAARRLGDALVVLINSDDSVARLKGPGRPVTNVQDRARVLAAFDCVDAVVVFDEDDPRAALAALRPDIWVKGGDYGATELPEAETVEASGGRVILLPYLSGRSTTSIIERSRQQAHRTSSASAMPIRTGRDIDLIERDQ
jgi:rfaE bifunctional protein nucleotidyltransferase chain/domain